MRFWFNFMKILMLMDIVGCIIYSFLDSLFEVLKFIELIVVCRIEFV